MKNKKAKTKAKVKAKAKPKSKGKAKAKAKVAPKPVSILKRAKIKPVRALLAISRKAVNIREDRRPEEKPLTNSEVQKFRDILLQKQEELSEIVHRKKEEQEFQQEEPEIGDEADIATRSVEKELLFDITDTEKQTLDGIEAALRKIEKGVYGRCESCQRTIPRLRLEVMPWARYDINCQAKNEVPTSSAVVE
jgi:DnaK suppressor protein